MMKTIEAMAITAAARQLPIPRERRRIRELARVSQEELAEVAGVQRASLTRWELGTRHPRGRLAERYAYALQRLSEATATPNVERSARKPSVRKAAAPAHDES
jgi:transcriptional regulator with XRE-family HTH domain